MSELLVVMLEAEEGRASISVRPEYKLKHLGVFLNSSLSPSYQIVDCLSISFSAAERKSDPISFLISNDEISGC